MARVPLIAGNWKMNGLRGDGIALAEAVAAGAGDVDCELLVCPPATILAAVGEAIAGSGVGLGGQDCHTAASGAHTGDVSAAMLADAGCSYVIAGHSERRADHGEGDDLVLAKAGAARAAGLRVIVCVGETEAQRDGGETLQVISTQLEGSVPKDATSEQLVVAYEPVWAIGTGRTPTPDEVQDVHDHIRIYLGAALGSGIADSVRLLYGGSVKPENAAELLALADVDGALVGGASLSAEDFFAIARSCL